MGFLQVKWISGQQDLSVAASAAALSLSDRQLARMHHGVTSWAKVHFWWQGCPLSHGHEPGTLKTYLSHITSIHTSFFSYSSGHKYLATYSWRCTTAACRVCCVCRVWAQQHLHAQGCLQKAAGKCLRCRFLMQEGVHSLRPRDIPLISYVLTKKTHGETKLLSLTMQRSEDFYNTGSYLKTPWRSSSYSVGNILS